MLGPLVGCATVFDPQALPSDAYQETVSDGEYGAAGRVYARRAEGDPDAGYRDGLHQAWRLEIDDGRVLTPWMTRPSLCTWNGTPCNFVVSASGEVAVYDDGEPLDEYDASRAEPTWYRVTPAGKQALPYAYVRRLPDASLVGFTATFDAAIGPEWPKVDRPSQLGYGREASPCVTSLSVVALDDAFRPRGDAVPLDPRAGIVWRIDGSLLRVSLPGRDEPAYFDGRLARVDLDDAQDFVVGGRSMTLALHDDGATLLDDWGGTWFFPGAWSGWTFADIDVLRPRLIELQRADEPLSDLLMITDVGSSVAVTSVVSYELHLFPVPANLHGRDGFEDTWGGLIVDRRVEDGDVWEVLWLGEIAEGEGSVAPDREQAIAGIEAALAETSAEYAAADVDVREAFGARLDVVAQLADAYRDALADHDLEAADAAMTGLDTILDDLWVPGEIEGADLLQARKARLRETSLDWELRRPDRGLDRLMARMVTFTANGTLSAPFWATIERLLFECDELPSRDTWEQIRMQGTYALSDAGRTRLADIGDAIEMHETLVRYQAAVAAGDMHAADNLAARLGEDKWIEHLLTTPSGPGRADLLKIALQRRPSGPVHDQLLAKRDEVLTEDSRIRAQASAEQSRAFDADMAAQNAASNAHTQRMNVIYDLIRHGADTSGF
ncbi:MAG: hypothetical protein H6825_01470 [Planctomycetes bacterium]|nr:hypothetical protein [Planctomycetota bacterium]